MKKKTFIVQLLDSKKPNRKSFTQVEDANFYSNDTDASLVFIPHEDTFNFETAKVVMYNRGDESLVERDAVVTTENGRKVASYELPAEIIAHWGDWTAQAVFTSGGEIYSGSIVPFSVIRYLMHERPATLTEIVTVTEFIQQSQALVDDMEQAETQRASAESNRISAETQRLSNETVRVSAEEQRVTDHANRSAELAGKADKVVLKNLIKNGDFSDGLTGWTSSNYSQFEVFENVATVTGAGNLVEISVINSHRLEEGVYYTRATMNVKNKQPLALRVRSAASGAWANYGSIVPELGSDYDVSGIIPSTSSHGQVFYQAFFQDAASSEGGILEISNVITINLTQIFGAGNEPTKEQMDELIKITGYIEGEYALNNKEMLIWTLALIRRNKNAIVALGGA